MSLETNVLRYLANCLERRADLDEGCIEMASPTQNEEAWRGYDSQVGLPDGRYLLLQFKRPLPRRPRATFEVPSGQVSALLWAGRGSSFFVLPDVGTNGEMWDAGTALLGRTLAVDAWDLYVPFAASMPEGLGWIYGSEPVVRTVRACSGAAAVALGGRWAGFWRLRARPISCFCGWGAPGFLVKGGAVRAPDGRKWGDRERRATAEDILRERAGSSSAGGDEDSLRAPDFRDPAPFGGASDKLASAKDTGKDATSAGGGLYAIKIADA